jgi:p-hydroxybenzoate 3-monooxygenase
VLETRSRQHVEQRVRAGVLEHGTVELLPAAGAGERLRSQGLTHRGINLAFAGDRHRIDLCDLTGGKQITVYGQQVGKDLIADHVGAGGHVEFEARATSVSEVGGERRLVTYEHGGVRHALVCDVVAGCDGSHGVCRAALKPGARTLYERSYPFAWLGVLAQTPPATEELIYAYHDHGFALHSMRSPDLTRLYLQVDAAEDPDGWPDARIWEEIEIRLGGPGLRPGQVLEKGVTPMRSLVTEPMQQGRLFLAGDAAHVVPPTGAKGMNLALADVRVLAEGLGFTGHQVAGEGSLGCANVIGSSTYRRRRSSIDEPSRSLLPTARFRDPTPTHSRTVMTTSGCRPCWGFSSGRSSSRGPSYSSLSSSARARARSCSRWTLTVGGQSSGGP